MDDEMTTTNSAQLNRCSECDSSTVYHNDLNQWLCIWVLNGKHLTKEEIDYFRKYGMRAWNQRYGNQSQSETVA